MTPPFPDDPMRLAYDGACLHFIQYGRHHCARITRIAFDPDVARAIAVVEERWGNTPDDAHEGFPMVHTVWTFDTQKRLTLDGVAHGTCAISIALRKLDPTLRAWVAREVGAAVRAARKAGAR